MVLLLGGCDPSHDVDVIEVGPVLARTGRTRQRETPVPSPRRSVSTTSYSPS
jgi:hypothetical protein